uniref:Uncharacterized protein n=1 Tax=Sus scrofa TaxID=9823 RepID=A0A8D0Z177_PIG
MSPLYEQRGSTPRALFIGPVNLPWDAGSPAMRGFTAALLVWTLVSPQGGGGEAWPTHVACRDGNLEVLYQSCAGVCWHVGRSPRSSSPRPQAQGGLATSYRIRKCSGWTEPQGFSPSAFLFRRGNLEPEEPCVPATATSRMEAAPSRALPGQLRMPPPA